MHQDMKFGDDERRWETEYTSRFHEKPTRAHDGVGDAGAGLPSSLHTKSAGWHHGRCGANLCAREEMPGDDARV